MRLNEQSFYESLDEMIEQSLGGFGHVQLIQAILVSLPLLFDAQQTFISVFTDAVPTWHCTDDTTCSSNLHICSLSRSSWSWDGPSDRTIVSEWSLECASSIITGLPSSSFFMGCLLGGFAFSTLGDSWLGRKKLLFFSCLAMSISASATILSANIWIYSLLRFVCGFFRSSIMTTALVLLMEMVGKRWRGQVGIIAFFFFTLGLLSLPAIAYTNRGSSWRILYFWTSIPAIAYCTIVYFFVCESPRWLFLQRREVEAMAVLKKFGPVNVDGFNSYLADIPLQEELTNKLDKYASMKDLFRRRWALRRLLAAMALGFGVGMVYYGMLLGVGNLGINTYLSLTLNGLLDIPAYFLTFLLIGRCKRTTSMLTFSIASGVCSIICGALSEHGGIQIGLELVAFFSSCTAFNVVLIYVTELFPTSVRNSATSMVRQALIFGAVFSPLLTSAGRKNEFLCYGVYGFVILCCGLFVAYLPETRGMVLFDTLDEQESHDNTIVIVS
ncbi:organic cation/carnitine transporter 2-like [Herrania umbratica]|uniref:Organic cation/carnitine transporter 2-like n=1 Tax=Herrania umbratica TaxID=108875 RepID=A0A6J1BIW8_9ROSI|nr:organic cation/carnitine transporter 2-like [Herrania umbratica]